MRRLFVPTLILFLFFLAGCNEGGFFDRLGDSVHPTEPDDPVSIVACETWESGIGDVDVCLQSLASSWSSDAYDRILGNVAVIAGVQLTANEIEALSLGGVQLFVEAPGYNGGPDYKRDPGSAHIVDTGDLFAFLIWFFELQALE